MLNWLKAPDGVKDFQYKELASDATRPDVTAIVGALATATLTGEFAPLKPKKPGVKTPD